jgi:antitoxin CptB
MSQVKRKRLLYRAWHRGTREMDMILGQFADAHVPGMSADELGQFDDLLKENDPDIYNWITQRETPPANVHSDVLARLIREQA